MTWIEGICILCGDFKRIRLRRKINRYTCQKCYLEFLAPKHICYICGENKSVQCRDENGNAICISCYIPPKEICSVCKNFNVVSTRVENNLPICNKCHGRPIEICSICKEKKIVATRNDNKDPICKKCYIQPLEVCSICKEEKIVAKRDENENPICPLCYTNIRYNTEEKFHTISLLRNRLGKAFKFYSKNGKNKSSTEYGVNYEDIFNYIGPCPGERADYHIDHIFPLVAFNFDDPEQLKLAFAPENHQWIKKEENLIKNDTYDEKDFLVYINKEKI